MQPTKQITVNECENTTFIYFVRNNYCCNPTIIVQCGNKSGTQTLMDDQPRSKHWQVEEHK